MSTGNLNLDLFLNELWESAQSEYEKAVNLMMKRYPKLSRKEAEEICSIALSAPSEKSNNSVSLAVTAPPSFSIRAKSTKNTVEGMIATANSNILITGYSLSDYFSDLIDIIIQKSQAGVFVEFFINNIGEQKSVDKLLRYKGRFLRIYNYASSSDKMSALHAKVISVDKKETLITSANLSYHGQEGNIELGTYIQSEQIANQVKDVFTQMVFKKIFIEI